MKRHPFHRLCASVRLAATARLFGDAPQEQRPRIGGTACKLRILLQRSKHMNKVEAAYRAKMDLGDGEAARSLGILLEQRGRLDEAEAAYRTGIELGDDRCRLPISNACSRRRTDSTRPRRSTGAESTWATVRPPARSVTCSRSRAGSTRLRRLYRTRIDLGDGGAATDLGRMLKKQGRFDEAEAAFRTGIDLGDGWAAYLFRSPARATGSARRG